MKAKIEVNEAVIKQALLAFFKNMDASEVVLKSQESYDYFDRGTGRTISATVTVDVGEAVAQ